MKKYRFYIMIVPCLFFSLFGCNHQTEIVSGIRKPDPKKAIMGETLLGKKFQQPAWSDEVKRKLEKDLEIAWAVFKTAPEREDSYIWLGRRLGYLFLLPDAIDVFSKGLEVFPDSYKLYRFRARHLVRNRQFDKGLADYLKAAELIDGKQDSFEPDGQINRQHKYLGTYKFTIPYYTGQAYWAKGDYSAMVSHLNKASSAKLCADFPDNVVPTAFWLYLAYRKLGDHDQAEQVVRSIPDQMDLLENDAYHQGVLILKGEAGDQPAPEFSSSIQSFAWGMKNIFDGEKSIGKDILLKTVEASALGFWPAEVELLRLNSEHTP